MARRQIKVSSVRHAHVRWNFFVRALAQQMSEQWKQPVIVSNRPGASGNIGVEAAVRAAPDGYTLLVGSQTTHAVVPTIAESGLPGYEAATWFGFFAPAAVPREIVAKLNADAVAGLNMAEVKERMAGQGYFVIASGVEPFAEFIAKEIPRWAKVVKAANITPQ